MATDARLKLAEVERRVCDIASVQLGIRRDRIAPGRPADRRPRLREP